jgi:hypothetical protein
MRKRTLRRVDVLENEERSRKLDQQSSLATISFFCRKIVLAYHVGGLKPDEEDPGEAEARALNYESRSDYLEALFKGEKQGIDRRFKNAARRLFAQAGRNFNRSPPRALFESFVRLVNQLPEPWWSWLQSNLKEGCHSAPFGTRCNIPAEFFRLQLQGQRVRQSFRVILAYLRKLARRYFRLSLRISCGRRARPASGYSADISAPR